MPAACGERLRTCAVGAALLLTACRAPAPVPGFQGRFVQLQDIRMWVELAGNGPPVLLLHGGTTSTATWSAQVPALASRFLVIAPDLRGHGRTSDSDEPLRYELLARDVVALLDSLRIDRAHLVGWSMGGATALAVALAAPERVASLVLIGTPFHADGLAPAFRSRLASIQAADWDSTVIAEYRRRAPDPSGWPVLFEKVRRLALSEPSFSRGQLARIRAPTLVIAGSREQVVDLDHMRRAQSAVPGARLLIIDGAGHHAHRTHAHIVNAAMIAFLREAPAILAK